MVKKIGTAKQDTRLDRWKLLYEPPAIRGPLGSFMGALFSNQWRSMHYDYDFQYALVEAFQCVPLKQIITKQPDTGVVCLYPTESDINNSAVGPFAAIRQRFIDTALSKEVLLGSSHSETSPYLLENDDNGGAWYVSSFALRLNSKDDENAEVIESGTTSVSDAYIPDYSERRFNDLIECPLISALYHIKSKPRPKKGFEHLEMRSRSVAGTHLLISSIVLPLILDVFRHRHRRFSSLPATLSRFYWENASRSDERRLEQRKMTSRLPRDKKSYNKNSSDPLHSLDLKIEFKDRSLPPWSNRSAVRTTTLAIDMRKSTKAMGEVDSAKWFARWLDELSEILQRIGHFHNGIFDKFTGDGALIHFIEPPDELQPNWKCSIAAATSTAREIHRAVKTLHLPRLYGMLQMNFSTFGMAAAIGDTEAHWSLDYRDNPIVVGRCVVQACRLCDKTGPGNTSMTNLCHKKLMLSEMEMADTFRKFHFESKENATEEGALIYVSPINKLLTTGSERDATYEICKRVYELSDRRYNERWPLVVSDKSKLSRKNASKSKTKK